MKKISGIFALLFAVLFSACENDSDQAVNDNVFHFSINASLEDLTPANNETRASGDYVVRLKWVTNDEISVVNVTTNKVLGGSLKSDKDGTSTTFSGTLNGQITTGDVLLFIYPSLGNTESVEFTNYVVDLSNQVGTTSGGVQFVASAKASYDGTDFSGKSYNFGFLMSYLQIALADLPKSTQIVNTKISGVPTQMTISYENGNVVTQSSDNGEITLTPSSTFKTFATGTRIVYLTIPPATSNSSRSVTITTPNAVYSSALGNPAFEKNLSYRTVVSGFSRIDATSLSLSAAYPASIPNALGSGSFDTGLAWKAGDAISVVNLTTDELLKNTLVADAAGAAATFAGDVVGDKGVNSGDKLLFLYPAVGNSAAVDFSASPIVYDNLAAQDGSLANAPVVLAAEGSYDGSAVTLTNVFKHISALAKVSADLQNASVNGSGTQGGDAPASGVLEGYGTEDGTWGEGYTFDVAKIELMNVPTGLMISSATVSGENSYKVVALAEGKNIVLSKSEGYVASVEDNIADDVYVALPAASGDGLNASVVVRYTDAENNTYVPAAKQVALKENTFVNIAY